ncbi:MAG TPA: hypothetical protein PKE57_03290 [Cellvibrionaceae bacterium]|nr:hypothetical protein [Cellvibrionaceae bacterium]
MKYLLLAMTFISVSSYAAGGTGLRKILGIGCHNGGDPVCYVTIEGAPVGPAGCNSTSIRWDSSLAGGKNQFALLTAAFMAGKPGDLFIMDTCFPLQPGYPTFSFSNL